ncbi:MAG TPA: phasin family protein [Nevskiaceae bacterium]|nr:phasin family protein [Nevskiaceae bacterium]
MAKNAFDETVLEPVFDFGKKLLDHGFALADIGTDTASKLGAQQAQFAGAVSEFGLHQFDLLPSLRDVQGYFVKQAEAGKALRDQSVQYVGGVREVLKDAGVRYAEVARKLVQPVAEAQA